MKIEVGPRYPDFIVRFLIVFLGAFGVGRGMGATPLEGLGDQAMADESRTADWLAYGRTHNERRFSPLTDVNAANVSGLRPDWYIDLPNDVGLVSTPLVVEGVLYFTGTMNIIRAVDATSGRLIWEYDPEVAKEVGDRKKVGWVHSRGISFSQGRLFLATWDGRLIALNARTGALLWSTRTFSLDRALYITGAPKAFKDKVLIGNGGTEHGPTRGWVAAYDSATGKEAWRFYIVPGNPKDGFENEAMARAAETWTGEWWKHGGGGNAWHGFTYDEELDLLYIGTGNGSPWNRRIRSPGGGENLYLCSIVALDPNTGEYRWHYQTTPGETWDYNSNMDIVLADLKLEGKEKKVILHAPKNGFFYVIERRSGKLLSAEPFTEVTWATHVDLETGRPIETPNARYQNGPGTIAPSNWGAHNWQAMSFNPQTGLVYIPTMHKTLVYSDEKISDDFRMSPFNIGFAVDLSLADDQPDYPASLQAWDPVKQRAVWTVTHDHFWNAGTLTTGGDLVFQGLADGQFNAYHAHTGERLWSFDAGLGISAPGITYKLEGKQYVAVLVGWGGGYAMESETRDLGWAYRAQHRRLIAFSLEGETEVPAQPGPFYPEPLDPKDFKIDDDLVTLGGAVWYNGCHGCHGLGAVSGGMAPDLRASFSVLDSKVFAQAVRGVSRLAQGMPAHKELKDRELEALRHFIRQAARTALPASDSKAD